MTRQEFLVLIRHPEDLNCEDTNALKYMTERFPYFTAARILCSFGLFKENDLDYTRELKKTIAYAPSRRKIKQLVESFRPVIESEIPTGTYEAPAHENIPEIEQPVETLFEIIPDNKKEIPAPIPSAIEEARTDDYPVRQPATGIPALKEDLIEKFIRDEPRISVQKATFFNPSDQAIKSNTDDDEIVSETLAILYYNQGNISKAIRIYEKLSLIYPEKSSIFAARIKEMKI